MILQFLEIDKHVKIFEIRKIYDKIISNLNFLIFWTARDKTISISIFQKLCNGASAPKFFGGAKNHIAPA